MSAASDKFERDIAKSLQEAIQIVDKRAKVKRNASSTAYSDIHIQALGKNTWCEVKMSHTDNLSNPRVYYSEGMWQTEYKTPAAKHTVDLLNGSKQAKEFVSAIAKFSEIPEDKIEIPTTKTGLRSKYAVPLDDMKAYFSQPGINRYIAEEKNYDLGKLVTEHYTQGKREPAYYMQAGDDFYMISKQNPFRLKGVPILSGMGDFRVRVSTRSVFYEIQAEIKLKDMGDSPFSVAANTKKRNPFETLF